MEEIEREIKCRKRILAIYNKTQEDFNTKEEWDDYLEAIEDIIYNLTNNIDVQQTEAKVSEYQRANRVAIINKQAQLAQAQRAAQLAAFQAAAAATAGGAEAAAAAAPAGPAAYTGAATAALLGAQPQPVGPVTQDAGGNLVRPRPLPPFASAAVGAAPASMVDDPGARAAGWSPDQPRMRALQEALGFLLLGPTSLPRAAAVH